MESLTKLFGFVLYVLYFIFCLLDDNSTTPKEMFVGLRSYDDWYYLLITLEYVLMLPLWMLIWNHTISPFLLGMFNRKS